MKLKKNSFRIRHVVESDGKDICWNDIMLTSLDLSSVLREIEYRSSKTDLKISRVQIRKLKRQIKQFEGRLYGEISDSIENAIKRKGTSKNRGNADALMKYRQNL